LIHSAFVNCESLRLSAIATVLLITLICSQEIITRLRYMGPFKKMCHAGATFGNMHTVEGGGWVLWPVTYFS